jgi:hypothetical protein
VTFIGEVGGNGGVNMVLRLSFDDQAEGIEEGELEREDSGEERGEGEVQPK